MVSVVVVVTTFESGEPEAVGESVSEVDISIVLLRRRRLPLPGR